MVRKIVRATAWGIKGALALVALAGLFLWPWSYGDPAVVVGDRWTVSTRRADRFLLQVGWEDGSVGISRFEVTYWWGEIYRRETASAVPGWRWTARAGRFDLPFQPHLVGIVPPDEEAGRYPYFQIRTTSLPCPLLALLAGAWPLASVALLVRRRRRARRLRRTGCCRRCGYDLRATPVAGGARLAVCPECGMASEAG